jgi:3-hydroxyisobutyrate dehydrogenase-like beta-hydroxyacid dehydrogenase
MAIADASLVLVSLIDYDVCEQLLREAEVSQALRGKTLVQFTSGSPRQARTLASWAAKNDVKYLDAAIMATPDLIGQADCTILYSGHSQVYDQYRATLIVLGGNSVHVSDDPGLASALDSALLAVMWGATFGMLYGSAVCKAEGLRLTDFAAYLAPMLTQINAWVNDGIQRIEQGRLAADATTLASIEVHEVAFRCFMELCKDREIHMQWPLAMHELLRGALRNGNGSDDFVMLVRSIIPRAYA